MVAFTARERFNWSLDRLYRVYASGSDLAFIKFGGQSFESYWGTTFGLIGVILYARSEKRSRAKLAAKGKALDILDLNELLERDKANFRLPAAEVVKSTIASRSFYDGSRVVGGWTLERRDGMRHDLRFEDVDEMKTGIAVLQSLLGPAQQTKVRWDEHKRRFVKAM